MSKDLKSIRKRVKKEVKDSVTCGVWDFARYLTGQDTAISKMWKIAEDKSTAPKERIEALDQWVKAVINEKVFGTWAWDVAFFTFRS